MEHAAEKIDHFADLQSDLDSAPVAKPKADKPEYKEACIRCAGSGRYRGPSRHGSHCFACDGKGYKIYKTKPEARAKSKAKNAAKRAAEAAKKAEEAARKAAEIVLKAEAWKAEHPAELAWLVANKGWSSFAMDLYNSLHTWGQLTEGQLAAVQKQVAKAAEPKIADANVGGEGFTKLQAGFLAARASGLKFPKLRIDEIEFTAAQDHSKNPGCLYVKNAGVYIGKISKAGEFFKAREATPADIELITRIGRDPFAEAVASGKRTGRCSCCGRELTDPASVEAGIGPICAGKWGW